MKRILYIVFAWIATVAFAQEQMPQQFQATCPGQLASSPYYYCDCRDAIPFQFPLAVEVKDTMWYSATLEDMKQGLAAYWISDCSITFEIYTFCNSKAPSFTMTVNKNQMREMSVEAINKKLEDMGDQAESLGQFLTPRIRVYPNDGGSGTVYCYPYDKGPESTCDSAFAFIPYMTYVCDKDTEVYELKPEKMSSKGRGFIRWKQKKNQPGTIWLTEGACDGPEIGRTMLSDSLHVYVLDSVKIKKLKTAGTSVFVHVAHDSSYVGRVYYRHSISWDKQQIDTTICQGKSLKINDSTFLTESTVYSGDTLWKRGDSLALTTYHLTIEPPTPQYDTLRLNYKQLPYTYKNKRITDWGDYDFTIHTTNKCDERYLVHVEHKYITQTTVVDTTLCLGRSIKIGGVTYWQDTVIRDSSWVYVAKTSTAQDKWVVRDISIHFEEPEVELDTISVLPSKMTTAGYFYSNVGCRVRYGDTLIVKKTTNGKTCTRYIQLHVDQDVVMTTGDTDTTLCMGKILTLNARSYATDTAFYDTIQVDDDTWRIGTVYVHFTEPKTELDTLVIAPSEMTLEGYHYEDLDVVLTAYGDTMIVKTAEDECTRHIQLHFTFDTTAIRLETDTMLCLGKTMTVGDMSYAVDTTVNDSAWVEPGLWMINTISMHFVALETEYDSISLTKSQIDSLGGYWYDSLEVMITAFGDTMIVKKADNECTRHIQLHVEEEIVPVKPEEAIEHTWAPAAGVYKYLDKGNLYIRREGKDYDLLGRPINRK